MAEAKDQPECETVLRDTGIDCDDTVAQDGLRRFPLLPDEPPQKSNLPVALAVFVGLFLIVLYLAWPVFDDLGMLH